jgi:hypothetical protein
LKATPILLAAALALLAAPARAEEPPMRSIPMVAVGGSLIGLGVANLATSPLCVSGGIQHRTACLGTSIAFGGTFLAAGIPLTIVGAQRIPPVMVAPTTGGALLTWRASW